jgi:hypothetical protein
MPIQISSRQRGTKIMRQATSKAVTGARANCRRVLPLAAGASMESSCKQTLDATKASLAAHGCSF